MTNIHGLKSKAKNLAYLINVESVKDNPSREKLERLTKAKNKCLEKIILLQDKAKRNDKRKFRKVEKR